MDKKSAKYFNLISNHIILVGIVCGIFYWVFESFVHTLIFKNGSFYTHLFKLTPHDLWMRVGVVLFFLVFSVYAQYISRSKKEEVMKYQQHLEGLILERTSDLHREIVGRKITEDRYRLLFNSIRDAVFVYKLNGDAKYGKFIEVNDTACKRLGYSREELLKLSVPDINPPEVVKVLPEKVKEFFNEKHILIETEHVTKDGRRIPTEINSYLFELDGHPAVLSTARDITDRKILEAERIRVLKEVAGALNHEINNPLAGILTTVYLLQSKHENDDYTSQKLSILKDNAGKIRDKIIKLSNTVAVVSADYPGGEKIIDIEKSAPHPNPLPAGESEGGI